VPLLVEEIDKVVEPVFSVSTSLSMEHELVKSQSALSQLLPLLPCSAPLGGLDMLLSLLLPLVATG
jgi:hypothetical protein